MRFTERLIGGSCIRLAFMSWIHPPFKKRKNKVYTHLFTFLAFRLIYMYANETFEKWNCVLVVPTEEYKVLPWKSAGLHGKREFCQNGETLSDEVENRYFHFHINSSSTKATWMVYLHGPGTSGLFQFLFPPPFSHILSFRSLFLFGSQVVVGLHFYISTGLYRPIRFNLQQSSPGC